MLDMDEENIFQIDSLCCFIVAFFLPHTLVLLGLKKLFSFNKL